MPFTIKTTFSFAGLEQGWSEDFYWSKQTNNLNEAEELVTPIADKRAKLLAQDYMLTVVRNAIVVNNLGQKTKRLTDIFEPRKRGVQSWKSAQPNVSLMCVWQTADNTQSKKQYMRGMPAGLGDAGKEPNLAFGAFLSNFNAWRSAMIAFQAGWHYTTVAPADQAVIESYSINADTGIVTFTLKAPGITWPNGQGFRQTVYVSLPGKSPLDGPVVIIPANATQVTTAEPIGVAPFIEGQFGIMQLRKPQLVTLAAFGNQGQTGQIHPQRMVTHKTGRPSYASRGRRPERAKW